MAGRKGLKVEGLKKVEEVEEVEPFPTVFLACVCARMRMCAHTCVCARV